MGTPNDDVWPGVGKLPDYKPTFPQWTKQDLSWIVQNLDEDGLDMLQVRVPTTCGPVIANKFLLIQATLTYDSAKRISGKSLLNWKIFF
jgi:cyclin-dependent kinase